MDELILELEREGARLGIVTSKMLDAVDLAWKALPPPIVWDVVITIEDSTRHKPHPEPLQVAMERLAATPAETVYIGDSPFDLQAAHAAGCDAIGVTWGVFDRDALTAESPLEIVDTPAELLRVLTT
jgi:pyrophosphatase PpaX